MTRITKRYSNIWISACLIDPNAINETGNIYLKSSRIVLNDLHIFDKNSRQEENNS